MKASSVNSYSYKTNEQLTACLSSKNRTIQAHLLMLVATLLIATSFPVAASIAGTMDSILLTTLRFLFSALLFLPIVAARHPQELITSWRSIPRYAALSAPLALFFVSIFEALRITTPIKTAALFTLGPILAALLGYVLVDERLTSKTIFALACGMFGALWIVFFDNYRLIEMNIALGDTVFLTGTVCFAFYTVLVKRLFRDEPMAVMTFWTLATGTGWLLIFGWDRLFQMNWAEIHSQTLSAIIYLAVFTTLITFFFTQKAVTVIGPAMTSAYTYLNPGLVLLLSWLLGGNPPLRNALPGAGLTLISMCILQLNSARGTK